MKKIILILIAMILVLSCGCSINNTAGNNSTNDLDNSSANSSAENNLTNTSENNTEVDSSSNSSTNNTAAGNTTVESSQNSSEESWLHTVTGNETDKASFEIYLVKNLTNCDPSKIDLSKLELEEKPLLTDKNISEYAWKSHRIKLIKDDELKKTIEDKIYMKTPVSGKPFVVVCNGEKIYCGAFWTLISSLYYPNLPNIISDYTDRDYFDIQFSGELDSKTMKPINDVRNDKRIYETFKKLGKLK